ncbi:bactofilin family protein [Rhodovibrionaceae bacterium A322]
MFRKRKDSSASKNNDPSLSSSTDGNTADFSSASESNMSERAPTPPVRELVRRPSDYVTNARRGNRGDDQGEGKKLTVGYGIKLAGEITACEKLVVEGEIQADLSSAQVLEIPEGGLFKGTATVDFADISGTFDGELTVRKRLSLRETGRVSGSISYRDIEIDCGGKISGKIEELAPAAPASASLSPLLGGTANQANAAEAANSSDVSPEPVESGA